MNRFKRLLCLILIVISLTSLLSGCGGKTPSGGQQTLSGRADYTNLPGYYVRLANEIRNDDDVIIGKDYYVFLDEECTKLVGTMSVIFGEDGLLERYEAVIGIMGLEKLISYTCGSGSSYYSEIKFDRESGAMTESLWENIVVNPETKEESLYKGTATYHDNGKMYKSSEEQYDISGGEEILSSLKELEYSKEGDLVSEVITNYDKNGVK